MKLITKQNPKAITFDVKTATVSQALTSKQLSGTITDLQDEKNPPKLGSMVFAPIEKLGPSLEIILSPDQLALNASPVLINGASSEIIALFQSTSQDDDAIEQGACQVTFAKFAPPQGETDQRQLEIVLLPAGVSVEFKANAIHENLRLSTETTDFILQRISKSFADIAELDQLLMNDCHDRIEQQLAAKEYDVVKDFVKRYYAPMINPDGECVLGSYHSLLAIVEQRINDDAIDYSTFKVPELRNLAKAMAIPNYGSMKKPALLAAVTAESKKSTVSSRPGA